MSITPPHLHPFCHCSPPSLSLSPPPTFTSILSSFQVRHHSTFTSLLPSSPHPSSPQTFVSNLPSSPQVPHPLNMCIHFAIIPHVIILTLQQQIASVLPSSPHSSTFTSHFCHHSHVIILALQQHLHPFCPLPHPSTFTSTFQPSFPCHHPHPSTTNCIRLAIIPMPSSSPYICKWMVNEVSRWMVLVSEQIMVYRSTCICNAKRTLKLQWVLFKFINLFFLFCPLV
jgi:hypothetical protein